MICNNRKSMHGNKLNFIGWLQYLHIFVNEKIADNNLLDYEKTLSESLGLHSAYLAPKDINNEFQ